MPSLSRPSTGRRAACLSTLILLAGPAVAGDLPAAERDVFSMPVSAGLGAPASACSFPKWAAGTNYQPLDIVMYGSRPYFAKAENPGYIPTVSTFFWGPYSCPVSAPPPARCTFTEWMQEWPYPAGSIVAYQGRHYIARHDNPGYIPTVSTWFWSPHDCAATTVTRQ